MKRTEEASTSSGGRDVKRRRTEKMVEEERFPQLEQGKLYFTPLAQTVVRQSKDPQNNVNYSSSRQTGIQRNNNNHVGKRDDDCDFTNKGKRSNCDYRAAVHANCEQPDENFISDCKRQIGGITSPLISSEDALGFSDVVDLIRPTKSIHFNFMVDLEWVMSCYPPSIRQNPITFVVGDSDTSELRKSAAHLEQVTVIPAELPIPFGTHHSKLSIFENEHTKMVHIIISTANLITGDWEFKTQQFYHCCGRRSEKEIEQKSDFQMDILEYLGYYRFLKVRKETGNYENILNSWKETLKMTDFGEVKDRLVFSVPGYHKGQGMKKLGHLRLRSLLAEAAESPKNAETPENRPLFVTQCSSIGSLGKTPAQWFRGEFLKSLEAGKSAPSTAPARMFLIYPTVENVRNSCQGYDAGCSLPYRMQTHARQEWMSQWLCQWRSEVWQRTKAMPHCKSYVKIIDQKPVWQVVTSANLSKAAWGELQKNGQQMCIRSYEIGVLIQDPERIRLPYDYPIVRYKPEDQPWTTDTKQLKEDVFGEKWIV